MTVEISIIVPVYNLKQFLPRCIDSILAQRFTNFELILVNDGSTDGSREICENYAKLDERIRVIHQQNQGVAASRNTGLKAAKGKYIGFVDNDDMIHPDMFLTLYETIKQYNSDIVICDYQKLTTDTPIHYENSNYFSIKHYDNIGALNQLYTKNNITFVVPWNKLYKKELFQNLRYKHGFVNDDETVIHELLHKCRKVTYIRSELYYYIQREDSQTGTFHLKRIDYIDALQLREQFFRKEGLMELHERAVLHFLEKFFFYYEWTKKLGPDGNELKRLKQSFNRTFPYAMRLNSLTKKQKIMYLIFRIHPQLFERLSDTLKKRNRSYVKE